jgi:hypothetical protein
MLIWRIITISHFYIAILHTFFKPHECLALKTFNRRTVKLYSRIKESVLDRVGEVTNAENIKADRPKILRPTHFSGPKDIKAEKWVVGIVP